MWSPTCWCIKEKNRTISLEKKEKQIKAASSVSVTEPMWPPHR